MRRLLIVAYLAPLMGLGACDAARAPCAVDDDCFVGERCLGQVCVLQGDPLDMAAVVDTGVDAAIFADVEVLDIGGNCLVDPAICGEFACNTATGECFKCEFDRQCGPNAACDAASGTCSCFANFHKCGFRCEADDDPTKCGESCEICPGDPVGTAICSADTCGVECPDGTFPCEGDACPTGTLCAECRDDDDCDASLPVCADGVCTGCESATECTRFPNAKICEGGGACVECTPSERSACNGVSCDPETFSCTTTPVRSKRLCEPCIADEECDGSDIRCVWMEFSGGRRPGGYCLFEPDEINGCQGAFPIQVQRVSLSGFPRTTYCTINEEVTTCEAHRDMTSICRLDEDCGAPELADGVCKFYDGADRCTYPCDTGAECWQGTCASYCVPNG